MQTRDNIDFLLGSHLERRKTQHSDFQKRELEKKKKFLKRKAALKKRLKNKQK